MFAQRAKGHGMAWRGMIQHEAWVLSLRPTRAFARSLAVPSPSLLAD